MATGMAVAVRMRRNEAFKKMIDEAVKRLATWPWKPVRVSTQLAKSVLIQHETIMANGKPYSTQVRNIGAGVKELYLELYKEGGDKDELKDAKS